MTGCCNFPCHAQKSSPYTSAFIRRVCCSLCNCSTQSIGQTSYLTAVPTRQQTSPPLVRVRSGFKKCYPRLVDAIDLSCDEIALSLNLTNDHALLARTQREQEHHLRLHAASPHRSRNLKVQTNRPYHAAGLTSVGRTDDNQRAQISND